jgi:prepilin peptidase CpaA
MLTLAIDITLLIFLSAAVYGDSRTRRIPNRLTVPVMIAGLAAHTATQGLPGLRFAAAGLAAGLGLLLLPYIMGGMGAGDVKMLAAVGALKGAMFVFSSFLCAAVVGGVIGLALALTRKTGRQTLRNIKTILWLMATRVNPRETFAHEPKTKGAFPYAGAIAGGVLLAFAFTPWLARYIGI